MYRIFDLAIDSELELPSLPVCRNLPASWSVTVLDNEPDSEGFERYHAWQDADGQEIMSAARQGSVYRVDFLGLARFFIDFEARRVGALTAAGCTDTSLAHLLVDQLFPRLVCHEGRLVLHASAVALPDGDAIAFAGVSGRGKSTLASAFYRAGHQLLSDDCLLLEQHNDEVFAVPPYASMRLWDDSADALFPGERQRGLLVSRMAHYTSKRVLSPEGPQAAAEPSHLRALFLIDPPGPLGVKPASGMAAIMALVEAQFALDVVSEDAVRRAFSAVEQVAGHVPVFRLTYPRDYPALPEVIRAVRGAAELRRTTGTA
jgi:hypothetical protein